MNDHVKPALLGQLNQIPMNSLHKKAFSLQVSGFRFHPFTLHRFTLHPSPFTLHP
jgi:hypothetical protein